MGCRGHKVGDVLQVALPVTAPEVRNNTAKQLRALFDYRRRMARRMLDDEAIKCGLTLGRARTKVVNAVRLGHPMIIAYARIMAVAATSSHARADAVSRAP